MKMYTRAFNKMSELNAFVNEQKIAKDSIVSIFSDGGLYFVSYYAE